MMLILLSPSKTMTSQPNYPTTLQHCIDRDLLKTQPATFTDLSENIVQQLRTHTKENTPGLNELKTLMKLSDQLTQSTVKLFDVWDSLGQQPAILSYTGDVFKGLDPFSWNENEWAYAQANLWVLSGLYGALRPLALICPYRLEMGLHLKGSLAKAFLKIFHNAVSSEKTASSEKINLAQLWRPALTPFFQNEINESHSYILNLSSIEYSQAIDFKKLKSKVCTPRFLDQNLKGDYKIISKHAKRARGLMARYALSVGASVPQDLIEFNVEGYQYSEAESQLKHGLLVFKRAYSSET